MHKSLKEIQNTIKQVKELNKTVQDLKVEMEWLKKTQRETALEKGNLGKRTGVTYASIINRMQKMEERISAAEDTIEDIDTLVKENTKSKKLLFQNIHETQDTMKRPNNRYREWRLSPQRAN